MSGAGDVRMNTTQCITLKHSLSGPFGDPFPILYCCEDMPQYDSERSGLEQIYAYIITPGWDM